MEDEFESLRKKSTRSSTIYEEMEADDGRSGGGSLKEFINKLTPGQRLLLSLLIFLNTLALGFGCMVLTGIITF
jgi:hypothetical protein